MWSWALTPGHPGFTALADGKLSPNVLVLQLGPGEKFRHRLALDAPAMKMLKTKHFLLK
jgi:hypothetical protein